MSGAPIIWIPALTGMTTKRTLFPAIEIRGRIEIYGGQLAASDLVVCKGTG
jgi:hypothetical protein